MKSTVEEIYSPGVFEKIVENDIALVAKMFEAKETGNLKNLPNDKRSFKDVLVGETVGVTRVDSG